jgi:hypothetical protein
MSIGLKFANQIELYINVGNIQNIITHFSIQISYLVHENKCFSDYDDKL